MGKKILLLLVYLFSAAVLAADITLDQQETSFPSGSPVILKYSGGDGLRPGAWVGVYKKGFHSNKENITYQNLKGDSGILTFSAPKQSGAYEFVLFDSGYEGKELARAAFTVSEVNRDSVLLVVDQKNYKPASSIKVELTLHDKLSAKAWLGIFPADAPHGVVGNYLNYQYAKSSKRQSLLFAAPEKPGNYELRFFDDDYGNEIVHVPFAVAGFETAGLSLKSDKKAYAPQETIKVHFTASGDFPEDAWIGLYEGNVTEATDTTAGYLDFRYMEKKVESDLHFKAPAVKSDYHFKMVSSYNGMVVEKAGFSVNRSLDSDYLKESIDETGRAVLYGIYFDVDKSEIKPASFFTLKAVGELLNNRQDLSLLIEGHTDDRGEADYNKKLSEKRAQAVKRHLTESFSIAANRLQAIGFGEEKPVNNNNTEAERMLNRRVEIVKLDSDH